LHYFNLSKNCALSPSLKADSKMILVTGANGFVGRAFCLEAIQRGFKVKGAVRTDSQLPPGVQPVIIGTINERTNWESALGGVEAVIHIAAHVHILDTNSADSLEKFRRVNTGGTEHLARVAAASGVKRMVFVSTIKVNGEQTFNAHKYTENDTPAPQDPYGISKWEAEQALHLVAKETGLEIVIVCPPLIYGAGVKGNFAQMLKVLNKGIPLPLASVRNLRSMVYIENFVDALLQCTTNPVAAGQTYLVSDGEDMSTPDLLHRLGVEIKHPARLLPCPAGLLKFAGKLTGRSDQIDRLLGSLQIDSSKIIRELNWRPPYTMQQGLQATAEWYRVSCG
jgi:nucleoside-diphosphate-sugar epimerase